MAPRVLLVDNYDSFTYNLVQELGELGAEPIVRRNDATDPDDVRAMGVDAVVVSPGPGRPEDGGVSMAVIAALAGEVPILGVCLGHQCIAQVYGGRIARAPVLMHGKTSNIVHDGSGLFAGLPPRFEATRYHSLVVDPASVPDVLRVTATADDGTIMGIEHRHLDVTGVQFHPESILSPDGPALLANFLARVAARRAGAPSAAGRSS